MSKQYIGKALTYLSKRRQAEGPQLCDKIAAILTDMPSAKVNALNSSLNFGWLRWQMRGVDIVIGETRGDRADKRRSAMLLVTCAKSAWIKEINDAQSWDDNVLDEVIGRYFNGQRSLPDIQGTGYYLKGSYWAFSNHSDREFTKAAWKEAVQMVQRGIEAASHNQALVTRWFGTADGNKVLENLQKIQTSMTTKRIGICYHGLKTVSNNGYKELGEDVNPRELRVKNDEWGYASPQASNHNNIGFGTKFFSSETMVRLPRKHRTDSPEAGMEITRGGAIVHELSHRYAKTDDKEVPNETYEYLDRAIQGNRAKAYNPHTCYAVAQSAPDTALENADNYRLFCEDSVVQ